MIKTGKDVACAQCGKVFYLPRWQEKRAKVNYCSHSCHSKSLVVSRIDVSCRNCGRRFKATPWEIKRGNGRVCSRKCAISVAVIAAAKAIKESDESEHSRWKGDNVGYFGVHDWMTKHYGQPVGCEQCGTSDPSKTYGWANISRKYKRDRNDFKRMCMSCHRKFDGAGKKAWATFLKRKRMAA